MMENRYDRYKDSGIAWIGEIPEHWKVRRMKSIYNFGKGLNITKADLVDKGIPVISYGQIHSKLNIGTCIKDSLIRYVSKVFLENNNTSLVKKGDVIFADTSEDLEGCGNCIYIDRDMLLYAGYHTIIAKNISTSYNRYFSYLFQTDCWRFQIRRLVNGVKLFSIPQKLLASTDVITPSTQEQQSIAAYLDQKCGEIDELITLQEEMITKLQSYKQSVITEAVTKGLDKNVPLKDSGIEWIGKIPEHWNICQLKRCANIINGYAFNSNHFSKDLGVPVIRIGDIINEIVSFENIVYVQGNNELDKFQVHKNDILIAMSGATVGKIGIYDIEDKAYVNQRVGIIRTKQYGFIKRMFATYGFANYVTLSSAGSAQPNISSDGILNFYIPLPPISEQQTIADYLDQRCSEIDELISIKQQKIEKLKEYKKSLIFECVTGKRKVC